jgi:tetratricopeptide (TPR) repeat protein
MNVGEELRHACVELSRQLRAGETCRAEDFLTAESMNDANGDSVLELLYTEFVVREELGHEPDPEDWYRRFPSRRGQLAELFQVHRYVCDQEDPRALDTAAPGDTRRDNKAEAAESRQRLVAGYALGEEIGRGGMGVVYRAHQLSLGRDVAFKMILTGDFASSTDYNRFQNEAKAAASLQHPNIAQVYEAGEEDGRAYLSMELVEGTNLESLLARAPLLARSAAELIETVARAVHYGHEHGVIHRDLKPSNVLITTDGRPKITDYGLAKRFTSEDLGLTRTGVVLGTPSYMPPEQSLGRAGEVSPAVDVYALGAILYEALTGRPPFVGDSALDTLQQVQEREPVSPRQINARVPRDLETICLKCLEKEPLRRYPNALELALDLRRFLNTEPIRARPTGAVAKAGRWCRRKPLVATLLLALGVVSIAAFATVVGLWRRAEHLRDAAELSLAQSVQNQRLARKTVEDFVVNVSKDLKLQTEDLRPLRKELLQQAVPFYEDLLAGYMSDPELRFEQGEALLRLAKITTEIGSEERAMELVESAIETFEQLVQENAHHVEYAERLADSLREAGVLFNRTGRAEEVPIVYGRCIEILDQLIDAHPENSELRYTRARAYNDRAVFFVQRGLMTEAESDWSQSIGLYRQLIEDVPQNMGYRGELTISLINMGGLHVSLEQYAKAQECLIESLAVQQAIVDMGGTDSNGQVKMATTHGNLSVLYMNQGDLGRFNEHHLLSVEILEKLVELHPSVANHQYRLVEAHMNGASVWGEHGRHADAEQKYQRAIDLAERLVNTHRSNLRYQRILGMVYLNLGKFHLQNENIQSGEASIRLAVACFDLLVAKEPDVDEYRELLSAAQSQLANALSRVPTN